MVSLRKLSGITALIIMFLTGFLNASFAADTGPSATTVTSVSGAMCNGYRIFNGPIGKTFALFAIVALGVGFFLGKVSWGTAIAIALGVGALFGAPTLVALLTGGPQICKEGQTDEFGAATS